MVNKKVVQIYVSRQNNTDPTLDTTRPHTGVGSTLRVATMRAIENFTTYNQSRLKKGAQPIFLEIRRIQ